MKAIQPKKNIIFSSLFLFLLVTLNSGCEQKRKPSNKLKIATEEFNVNQNTEAQFLISISNLSKNIIAANEIAMSKTTNQEIKNFSIDVKNEQLSLLENVTNLANNNLIILTELNSNDIKKNKNTIVINQETNFDEQYIDYLFFALSQEIKIFEEIILQTQDVDIINLVNVAIPKQQKFILKLHNFKNESIYKQL